MTETKRKLTIEEQMTHLKNKGIKFEHCSEEHAKQYLQNNNNFFKIRAYRKNYPKHTDGKKTGQYINLDFQYLIDLAVLDMELRYLLVHLALDVEHYVRMQLIKCVEETEEDGYTIVSDYINSLEGDKKENFQKELYRNKGNIYCGAIAEKYDGNYPVWAFVEIIPFGRLVSFYKFCAERFGNKQMRENYYRLMACKEIRNAAAHNNCILNDLISGNAQFKTDNQINRTLMEIDGMTKPVRKRKMANARVQQIVTLLYTHKTMVTSQSVLKKECEKIHLFVQRMFKNIEFYKDNDVIRTTFYFLKMVVDSWYPVEYNDDTEKK